MAMQLEIYVYMHPSVLVYETRSNCGWDDVECRWKEGGRSARELEAGLGLGFVAFSLLFFFQLFHCRSILLYRTRSNWISA
jgi:hypothetical protein